MLLLILLSQSAHSKSIHPKPGLLQLIPAKGLFFSPPVPASLFFELPAVLSDLLFVIFP